MPCAIIIVTYNPDKETLYYIGELSNGKYRLIVVDNSTRNYDFSDIEGSANGMVISNNGNAGLATALNTGIAAALQEGINDIFLFDQDSRIPPNFIEDMLEFKQNASDPDCAIIAPNFIDTNIGTEARFTILNKWSWNSVTCDNNIDPLYVSFAITSGSLLDGKLYQKLGPLRDEYFIDHVDSEYCLRAISNGFKIRVNCKVALRHKIGDRILKKLFGVTIKPNNHNSVRRYYIFRNGVRMMIEYGPYYPSVISLNIARLVHEIIAVCFFERQKYSKLNAMLKGVWHGMTNKMGAASNKID